MLPVIIFEPDEEARSYLSGCVADYCKNTDSQMNLIGNASSAEETIRFLQEEKGIVLMMLGIITGKDERRRQAVQIGRSVIRSNRDSYTLFCLHNSQDLEALLNTGVRPAGVLIKPFEKEKLEKLLLRIDRDYSEMHEEEAGECLVVDSGNSTYRIPYSRILYIEALDKKLTIWTSRQRISVRATLNALAETLPHGFFYRCHRSYMVNVRAIDHVDFTAMEVVLTSGESLPLARTARDSMRDLLEKERKKNSGT